MRNSKAIQILVLAIGVFMLSITSSCGLFNMSPETRPLNIELGYTALYRQFPNYLVSNEKYMRLYESQDLMSRVVDIVRKGDIVILVRAGGQDRSSMYWYEIRKGKYKGWVLVINPILAYSIEQAEQHSKNLLYHK